MFSYETTESAPATETPEDVSAFLCMPIKAPVYMDCAKITVIYENEVS